MRRTFGVVKGGYIGFGQLNGGPSPDKPLVIGEGVETTLAAVQLSGLPGIAGGGNMAAVTPPPCSAVIIAADNDAPGRKAAAELTERLQFRGIKVQIAMSPVPDTDWNQRLQKADDAKAEWEAALADAPSADDPIAALELDDFMRLTFPRRELLLDPWLPNPGLVMVHAQRGHGKTYFALAVGNAVASNAAFCGWQCKHAGRVLYVDGELPGDDLQQRLHKLPPVPNGQFYVLSRDTFLLRKQTMPDLGEPEGRQELDRIIKLCNPDLLILDSKSTLMRSGVENEAESWSPIQDWLLKHRWHGLTIMLLHHEGKTGKPRGTSKTEDVLDTMIGLHVVPDLSEDGKETVFELRFTKHRDFFGADAAPMELHFQIVDGQTQWRSQKVKDVRKERIREMLADGMTHEEIAEELGDVKRSRISQIAKNLKAAGDLKPGPAKRRSLATRKR